MVLIALLSLSGFIPVVILQHLTLTPSPLAKAKVGDALLLQCSSNWKGKWKSLVIDELKSTRAPLGFFLGDCENIGSYDATKYNVTCDKENVKFSLMYHKLRETDNGKEILCKFTTVSEDAKPNHAEGVRTKIVIQDESQRGVSNLICRHMHPENHITWIVSNTSVEDIGLKRNVFKLQSGDCPGMGNYKCDADVHDAVKIETLYLDMKCELKLERVWTKYQNSTSNSEPENIHIIVKIEANPKPRVPDQETEYITFPDTSAFSFNMTIDSDRDWYYINIEKSSDTILDLIRADAEPYSIEMENGLGSVSFNFTPSTAKRSKPQHVAFRWNATYVSAVSGGPFIVLVVFIVTVGLICTITKRNHIKIQRQEDFLEDDQAIYDNNARILELEAPEPYDNLEVSNDFYEGRGYGIIEKPIPDYIEPIQDDSTSENSSQSSTDYIEDSDMNTDYIEPRPDDSTSENSSQSSTDYIEDSYMNTDYIEPIQDDSTSENSSQSSTDYIEDSYMNTDMQVYMNTLMEQN